MHLYAFKHYYQPMSSVQLCEHKQSVTFDSPAVTPKKLKYKLIDFYLEEHTMISKHNRINNI